MPHKMGKEVVLTKLSWMAMFWMCNDFPKMIMVANSEAIMKDASLVNLVTWLWAKLRSFSILKHNLLEFMKVVEIACVQFFGFMEGEHNFSSMKFMENKLKNYSILHLNLCIIFMHKSFKTFKISFLKKPWPSGAHGQNFFWNSGSTRLAMSVICIECVFAYCVDCVFALFFQFLCTFITNSHNLYVFGLLIYVCFKIRPNSQT